MRKSVMVLLADKASDDGGGIWASKQTMADELCCSKQTVIDTIKSFIEEGLVKEIGQRRNANGYTVEYGINIAALEAVPLVNCHAQHQSNKLTGQPAGPVKGIDGTGQPAGPKPSKNPPVKNTHPLHVIPEGWEPKQFGLKTISRSVVDGWPPGEAEAQLEHFTAHHRRSGQKFKDWQDAWSTWVLNSRRFGSVKNANRNSGTTGNRKSDGWGAVLREVGGREAGYSSP